MKSILVIFIIFMAAQSAKQFGLRRGGVYRDLLIGYPDDLYYDDKRGILRPRTQRGFQILQDEFGDDYGRD